MPFSICEASSFLLSFGCFLFSPSVSLKLTLAGSPEFDVLIRKSAERMKERGRETLQIPTYWFSCRLSFCSHSLSSLSFLLLWCEKAVHRQGVFVFSFSFCFFLVSLLIREQLNRWRLKGYPVEWHRWREREKEREEALSREIEGLLYESDQRFDTILHSFLSSEELSSGLRTSALSTQASN